MVPDQFAVLRILAFSLMECIVHVRQSSDSMSSLEAQDALHGTQNQRLSRKLFDPFKTATHFHILLYNISNYRSLYVLSD